MSSTARPTVDPNSVPLRTRQAWCMSELSVCDAVCTRIGVVLANGNSTQTNTCDFVNLKYECLCARNVEPNIGAYKASMPAFTCNEANKECSSAKRTTKRSSPIRIARLLQQDIEARQQTGCTTYQCGTLDTPATDTASTSTTKAPSTTTSSLNSKSTRTAATATSTTASSTSIAPVVPSETNTSVMESPPLSGGQGLGTGAKAGIGVGSALGGLLIFALLGYWYYVVRKRKQDSKMGHAPEGFRKAELADTQTLGHSIPQELDAPTGKSEMAHTQEPRRPPVELG